MKFFMVIWITFVPGEKFPFHVSEPVDAKETCELASVITRTTANKAFLDMAAKGYKVEIQCMQAPLKG